MEERLQPRSHLCTWKHRNMCKKSIMDPITHTQYRPICVSAHPVMVPQTIPFRWRFNFMKADWNGYSVELVKLIEDVDPIPVNYKCFVENVQVASRRHIPRGCRTEYLLLTNQRVYMIQNTKMKVATRNNLLKKFANPKWGTNASTIRTTSLALC